MYIRTFQYYYSSFMKKGILMNLNKRPLSIAWMGINVNKKTDLINLKNINTLFHLKLHPRQIILWIDKLNNIGSAIGFQLVLLSLIVILSSCLIWQIIRFIPPLKKVIWRTLYFSPSYVWTLYLSANKYTVFINAYTISKYVCTRLILNYLICVWILSILNKNIWLG